MFAGPSIMFNFADSLTLMIIGQLLLGFMMPFMFVPALPEMTESTLHSYDKSVHERVNNMSSGVFSAFMGLGSCLGPIYGSYASSAIGFRSS